MSVPTYKVEQNEVGARVAIWTFSGAPTLSEWNRALARGALWMRDLESRGRRVGVVVDLTEQTNLGIEARRLAGQWRAENMPLIANTLVCAAYVAPNALIRGFVTAAFWFARPVIPVSFKATRSAAVQWCADEVQRLTTIPPPA